MTTVSEFKAIHNLSDSNWKTLKKKAQGQFEGEIVTQVDSKTFEINPAAESLLISLVPSKSVFVEAELIDTQISSLAVVEPNKRQYGNSFALATLADSTQGAKDKTLAIQENLLGQVAMISDGLRAYRQNLQTHTQEQFEQVQAIEMANATLEAEIALTRKIEAEAKVEADFLAERKKQQAAKFAELQSLLS